MMQYRRVLVAAAVALALAGCGGGDKETAQGSAGGEILPGSASDAMLPLDTVRSQPPLAPKSEASPGAKPGAKRGSAAEDGGSAEAVEPSEPAAPGPAETPEGE
jgi:hypothetical protein